MSVELLSKDNKTFSVDAELLKKYTSQNDVFIKLDSSHIKLILDYINHHGDKESKAPAVTVNQTTKHDNIFKDSWDLAFIKRVVEEEKSEMMIDFCKTVEMLDMDTLLSKLALYIVIALYQNPEISKDENVIAEIKKLSCD